MSQATRFRRLVFAALPAPAVRALFCALLCATAGALSAFAATPATLVRDLRHDPGPSLSSSSPSSFVSLGGRALFWARTPLLGAELYRTDGTVAGTALIADLCPGRCDSLAQLEVAPIAAVGFAFFLATDGSRGLELWRSDGTTAGTRPMIDLVPGPEDGTYLFLLDGGDRALFAALPPRGEGLDLWASDGTAAGTAPFARVRDEGVTPLSEQAALAPRGPLPEGRRVYFEFFVGSARTVWESDGTAFGTRKVRLVPETGSTLPCVERGDLPRVVRGGLVLAIASGGTGCEPWYAADGIARPLGDLAPGARGSFPHGVVTFGDLTLFAANVPGLGEELWRTDGTAAGTLLVGDAFVGTSSGFPRYLGRLEDEAYFRLCDEESGCEVWGTSGAVGSLHRLTDFAPGAASSNPTSAGVAGGRLFLNMIADAGAEDLVALESDGTLVRLASVPDGSIPVPFAAAGPLAIFGADLGDGRGIELAVSDGTAPGTGALVDLSRGDSSSNPAQLTRTAGRLLFTATDDVLGNQVWRTDGTAAGTGLVAVLPGGVGLLLAPTSFGVALQAPDGSVRHARARSGGIPFLFRPEGEFPSADAGFALGGAALFFVSAGDAPSSTLSLWRTNGRPDGTVRLAQIARFNPLVGYRLTTAVAPDRKFAYFLPTNTDGEVGDLTDGLWRTDGTAAGTRRVVARPCDPCTDVRAGEAVVAAGGKLFYVIEDLADRFSQLWVSDGTGAGTKKLLEGPGTFDGGAIQALARRGTRVLFVAFDAEHGRELWTTDGTKAGTRRLIDLRPGDASSAPEELTSLGNRVYFSADDGKAGRELWTTDGTAGGTRRVADIRPGYRGSVPQALTAIGDRLVFAADDGTHGLEVWSSDGTAAGTRLASDVQVGRLPSSPRDFVALGSNLLFVAERAESGRELYRLPLSALSAD